MAEILTVDGYRAPPSSFVKKLEAFDPNLRVVWGLSQAVPFPGWVIERRIPLHMKAKVYGGNKPANRQRFFDQQITDGGNVVGRRQYDAMPDWHPIYRVMDEEGRPITELGEFVINYLRRNYQRTLLGFPELSEKFHRQDMAERAAFEEKKHDDFLTATSEKVMDHRNEVWPEHFAASRPVTIIKEGTTNVYRDNGCSPRITSEDSGSPLAHQGSTETGS